MVKKHTLLIFAHPHPRGVRTFSPGEAQEKYKVALSDAAGICPKKSAWPVRHIVPRGLGCGPVGAHVGAQQGKVRSVPGPLKIVRVTAKVPLWQRKTDFREMVKQWGKSVP